MNVNAPTMNLSVVSVSEGFALADNGQHLRTPGGQILQHPSEELMQHILRDTATWQSATIDGGVVSIPVSTSALSLLSVALDVTMADGDRLLKDITPFLMADPVLFTVPGPEQMSREATYGPVHLWMSEHMPALRGHVTELQSQAFGFEEEGEQQPLTTDVKQAIEFVQWLYAELSAEQRAVINVLATIHDRCLLLAMSLIVNPECDEHRYADGVIGALMLDPNAFTDASYGETQRLRDRLVRDAAQAMEFLAVVTDYDDADLDEEE